MTTETEHALRLAELTVGPLQPWQRRQLEAALDGKPLTIMLRPVRRIPLDLMEALVAIVRAAQHPTGDDRERCPTCGVASSWIGRPDSPHCDDDWHEGL